VEGSALNLDMIDRTPHLPTRVVEAIRREIGEGRLKPGDRLPGEQMLAETFGVSRNVVREAGLAAKRGTAGHRAAISAALDRMRGIEKWADKGVDADLEFHRAVALATGNDYIARVVGFVSEHMRESIMATRRRPNIKLDDIVDITIAEHVAIHDAIMDGAPARARDAMEQHIINAAHRVGITILADD